MKSQFTLENNSKNCGKTSDWKKVITLGSRIKAAFSIPFKSMTPKDFFDKVVEMRRCQKEYLKNKRQIDLRISKQIEREVDEEIERVQKSFTTNRIRNSFRLWLI